MKIKFANETGYEEITLLGVPALFTFERLFRGSEPVGTYLYELQKSDEMRGGLRCLAQRIPVNLYGSVITTEPIQLPVDGYLDINQNDIVNTGEHYSNIQDFIEKHPSADNDIMHFAIMKQDEHNLLNPHWDEWEKANHYIGYVRGDFEANKKLHTTWWLSQQDDMLNTPQFKEDLQRVVEWLRKGFAPLRDLETMGRFCSLHESTAKDPYGSGETYGFRIDTNNYMYALGCTPDQGSYHMYLHCYGKDEGEAVWKNWDYKYFKRLKRLLDKGITNMYDAALHLQKEFAELRYNPKRAKEILSAWIQLYYEEDDDT